MLTEIYPFIQFYIFIIGISIGSFLNVVIYRFPIGLSLIKPRSKCTNCKSKIKWYDNLPILSYIFLRAKCRKCNTKISFRYPLIELLCGIISILLLSIYGFTINYIFVTIITYLLIAISFIDAEHYIIPNEFIIFGFLILLIGQFTSALNITILDSFYGALCFSGVLFFTGLLGTYTFKKEAMGFGDVKLAFVIGGIIGFELSILALFLSFVFAALMSIILLISKEVKNDRQIPFGPSISAATILIFLTKTASGGNQIINWYFTNMF